MIGTTRTLAQFVTTSYFAERDLRTSSRLFILFKLNVFKKFLGHEPTIDDLNAQTINAFLDHRLTERSRETVRGERNVLHCLWQAAFDDHLLEIPPLRIKKIKKQLRPVEAWDESQVLTLISHAQKVQGRFRGSTVKRADFWESVIRVLFETGLRVGDLRNLDAAQISHSGTFTVIQQKTGKPVEVEISEETWECVQRIEPRTRKKPFGDMLCRRQFFDRFAAICKEAGVDGRCQMLRRTAGSIVERDFPGEGHYLLGNGRDVFLKHYNSARISRRPVRRPRLS